MKRSLTIIIALGGGQVVAVVAEDVERSRRPARSRWLSMKLSVTPPVDLAPCRVPAADAAAAKRVDQSTVPRRRRCGEGGRRSGDGIVQDRRLVDRPD